MLSRPSPDRLRLQRVPPPLAMTDLAILDPSGDEIGRVEDWMVDPDTGCVACVVASFPALLGSADVLLPIPPGALGIVPGRRCYVLDPRRNPPVGAPGFRRAEWPETAGRCWLEAVYHYHGQVLPFGAAPREVRH